MNEKLLESVNKKLSKVLINQAEIKMKLGIHISPNAKATIFSISNDPYYDVNRHMMRTEIKALKENLQDYINGKLSSQKALELLCIGYSNQTLMRTGHTTHFDFESAEGRNISEKYGPYWQKFILGLEYTPEKRIEIVFKHLIKDLETCLNDREYDEKIRDNDFMPKEAYNSEY